MRQAYSPPHRSPPAGGSGHLEQQIPPSIPILTLPTSLRPFGQPFLRVLPSPRSPIVSPPFATHWSGVSISVVSGGVVGGVPTGTSPGVAWVGPVGATSP